MIKWKICEKYSLKIGKEMNSLLFLYGGNQVNLELNFKEQANSIGINDNEMKILVYTNEKEFLIVPNVDKKLN